VYGDSDVEDFAAAAALWDVQTGGDGLLEKVDLVTDARSRPDLIAGEQGADAKVFGPGGTRGILANKGWLSKLLPTIIKGAIEEFTSHLPLLMRGPCEGALSRENSTAQACGPWLQKEVRGWLAPRRTAGLYEARHTIACAR